MELGATVCVARRPRCDVCPVQPLVSPAPAGWWPRSGACDPAEVPFEQTTRWLRGRIVERLRALDDGAWLRLPETIGTHGEAEIDAAVAGLERDGSARATPRWVGAPTIGSDMTTTLDPTTELPAARHPTRPSSATASISTRSPSAGAGRPRWSR